MLIGRKLIGSCRKGGDDLVVFADDESYALNKVVTDLGAAHVLHARFWAGCRQIVGCSDFAIDVGGHRKPSGTIIRVCRERIESLDAVGRYPNDGGTGGIELVFLLRERMRFQ